MNPFWQAYVSKGLLQPPTRYMFFCLSKSLDQLSNLNLGFTKAFLRSPNNQWYVVFSPLGNINCFMNLWKPSFWELDDIRFLFTWICLVGVFVDILDILSTMVKITWEHILWIFVSIRILKPWENPRIPGQRLGKAPRRFKQLMERTWWFLWPRSLRTGHCCDAGGYRRVGRFIVKDVMFQAFSMGNRYDKDFKPIWLGNKSKYVGVLICLPLSVGFPSFFKWNSSFKSISLGFHTPSTLKRYDMYDWAQKTYHPNTVHLRRYDWKTIGKDKKLKNVSQHLQSNAKWFRDRVSIHHPLGFNWHPFEGPGQCWFMFFFLPASCSKSQWRFQWCQTCLTCVWRNLGRFDVFPWFLVG